MRRFLLLALVLTLVPVTGRSAPRPTSEMQYVTVWPGTPDEVEIAVRVLPPAVADWDTGKQYPALVEVEGYGGASSPNDPSFVGDPNYVVVAVSLRGTGCSGGQLSLFSEQSSRDVAWIIDNWIPGREWSNGKVGIYGHSYGGLTGFLVAAAVPDTTHLKAVAVSGLIDDFYRGILYPGGISNYGFPLLWGALSRPASEHQSNAPYLQSDAHCRANYAQHETSDAVPSPSLVLDTYGSPYTKDPATGDDVWAIRNALMSHVADIKVPIQLGQQYQDEQTGPRGGHVLWENIPANVPKRIQISTGMHNPNDPTGNKRDWLDCWILRDGDTTKSSTLGHPCADVLDTNKKVLLYFESYGANRLAPYVASDWPLPNTDWRRYYLRADNTLSNTDAGTPGEVVYASTGNGRHTTGNFGRAVGVPGYPATPTPTPLPTPTSPPPPPPLPDPYNRLEPYGFTTGLPDTARYTLGFTQDTALAGPIDLTLWAKISSPDTDFWAEILDRDADPNSPTYGATTFVQRGLLRASFNATFDESKSQKTPGGAIYRPYYAYTATTPVVPGAPNKYEVEIFPLGHVWRAGHQLVLQLHAPPASDPLSIYMYEPSPPSVVTILQDADHPTSILLPFMPALPPYRSTPPDCGQVVGELCVTPAVG